MEMTILVASSGFKESLAAEEVADRIEAGILKVLPGARVAKLPMADGGEGFSRTLTNATGGQLHRATVTGPMGEPVQAHYGFLGDGTPGPRTAVLEMATAAGLRLVPREVRDACGTTTYGVGELILDALNAGAERILLGCGDSGTTDGGAGALQALGARLLDSNGQKLGRGGMELERLERVDLSDLDPRLTQVPVDLTCNPYNVLCGPGGVARVFGPQKGASPGAVERLAAALENYASVIHQQLGLDVREMPAGGASGGLGAGLYALAGATLHPRYEIISRYLDVQSLLEGADLVVTAEGGIDFQTPRGKIPAEIAGQAKRYGLPVVAIVGTVGKDAQINHDHGIDAYTSVIQAPCTLEEALERGPELVEICAEDVMRLILVGRRLSSRNLSEWENAQVG